MTFNAMNQSVPVLPMKGAILMRLIQGEGES
jgi:hypothetical protein